MADTKTNKTSNAYSLDPVVIAWAAQKAARLTIQSGKQVSASAVVNDILKREMETELQSENGVKVHKSILPRVTKKGNKS